MLSTRCRTQLHVEQFRNYFRNDRHRRSRALLVWLCDSDKSAEPVKSAMEQNEEYYELISRISRLRFPLIRPGSGRNQVDSDFVSESATRLYDETRGNSIRIRNGLPLSRPAT